jgi:type I restriction enzyme, S subunit
MNTWQRIRLGEVARVFNGKTPSQSQQRSSGEPVLKVKDVDTYGNFRGTFESFVDPSLAEKFAAKRLCQGDTLVLNAAHNSSYVGSKTFFARNDSIGALPTGEWLIVRPNITVLEPAYFYHWLGRSSTRRAIKDMVKGIHLYPKDVARLTIHLPPLADQQRVAEVLDKVDTLRAKRRATITELDKLGKSIFLDMFGDVPANPKRWPITPVSAYVAAFEGGRSFDSEAGKNAVTARRILKVSAVTGMRFAAEQSKPVPDDYRAASNHFVRCGDLLFSRANTTDLVGAVAYVNETPDNLLLPDKIWRFVWSRPEQIEPLFIWALFQTRAVRDEISRRATGTSGSMKNISQEKVLGINTICPPVEEQRRFAQAIEVVERIRSSQLRAQASIDALFASLQHRAFRGEL